MRVSTFRRLAAPLVAGVAAVGLIVAGSGTAMAADPPPAWSGDKTADNLRWNLSLSAVNGAAVDRTQVGVNVVYPGDTVTYTAKIWKNSGIGRYITTIRQIAPAGFQYQSNAVSKQSTVTNEGTAGVKATCSGGGCNSVPVLGNKGYLDNVDFAVTYKIPDTQAAGDYNAGFPLRRVLVLHRAGHQPRRRVGSCRRPGPHDNDGADPGVRDDGRTRNPYGDCGSSQRRRPGAIQGRRLEHRLSGHPGERCRDADTHLRHSRLARHHRSVHRG
ncbi:hypothetical protein GS575_05285 [Rhodococcus hoagii]|nr:hypothetical protein [Prescottella equi]